jgi:hypothetical protein
MPPTLGEVERPACTRPRDSAPNSRGFKMQGTTSDDTVTTGESKKKKNAKEARTLP